MHETHHPRRTAVVRQDLHRHPHPATAARGGPARRRGQVRLPDRPRRRALPGRRTAGAERHLGQCLPGPFFFVSNIVDCAAWGHEQGLDLLLSESAGLCNRCAPHIRGLYAVCVLDNLAGVDTPFKIGPMLKTADLVVITKADIVSQAEREVFAHRVRQVNRKARILFANGITGQGAWEIGQLWRDAAEDDELTGGRLRFSLPSAVCSYCFGQTKIGHEFQRGVVRRIEIPGLETGGEQEQAQ
ncbi:GTP-binding protein [Azotobacter vinelandii]